MNIENPIEKEDLIHDLNLILEVIEKDIKEANENVYEFSETRKKLFLDHLEKTKKIYQDFLNEVETQK